MIILTSVAIVTALVSLSQILQIKVEIAENKEIIKAIDELLEEIRAIK